MKHFFLLSYALFLLVSILFTQTAFSQPNPPNIIYILADDLGYRELGSYGQQKIKTPYLDQLAAEGMRFTQHYAGSAVCAPSRCTLLTGQHNLADQHHEIVEQIQRLMHTRTPSHIQDWNFE